MPDHIAIVEDEAAIAANYRDSLQRLGYRVSIYHDRASATDAFSRNLPDLAIIDIGLGDEIEGGFELCQDLRRRSATLPIIILTARDSDMDAVVGLRLGADDYQVKGISQIQLQARIAGLLKKVKALREPERKEHVIVQGQLMLNQERMTASWKDTLIALTVTEFHMIHALAQHPGHVKTRDQLMDSADVSLDHNTVTSHIKRIRRKFEEVDTDFSSIETVYGTGYRWTGK